jgi:hypothetical protein
VISHVRDDRIQDIRGVFDGLMMLQQLGVVPAPTGH